MPRPFLPLLLTLALAACDVSTVVTPVSSDAAQPNAVSITETSITDDQVTVSWSASGPEPAEHWRLYQNNLLVCSADLDLELSSSDASGNYQQSDTCTLTLEDGENSIYVQLCNISENGTSTCSTSAIQQIFYAAADPTPGAISWQDLPSSTSATTISATWLKADGGNGDYWFVYHDGAQACSGSLSYVEDYVAQSADCTINLAEGVNQLQAELCSDQPAGIQDLCTQSEVASVTFTLDPAKELATPVLDALDEDIHYAGIDTNISWYKDTSSGSAGDDWSLYHNGTVVCQAQLADGATSASCTIQLTTGDNALQVELCTDITTYSGASCTQSATLAVAALDPEPITPGLIRIANVSTTLAETSDSVAPLEWVIDIGSGVQHWSVDLNGAEYCVTSSTSEYYQEGSCLLNLVVGINTISVRGCNYGYDDVAACSTSESITTERVALPGTPELTSSLPTTTYTAEHNLSWERTTGASAERWLAFVDGDIESDQCHTELNPQTPQSDSCIVELGSGINEVLVRLCVDSSTAAYCVDSASLYTELLAPIPATPEISTASQSIADDSIELEWSKSSGEHGSYWLAWNNDAEVAACADRPLLSAGDGQSGSCDLPLGVGENIVSVRLCNDNNAGTASCADSTTISITRLVASPEFTSATSVSTAENSVAVFYTATVEDNDSSAEQISFALSGGEDVDFFQLDSASGALAFHTPVDYEIPQDSDSDNVYQVALTATDELNGSAQLELAVSLSNSNDNLPILTTPPASLTVAENDSSVIYTFTASDLDGDALIYSLDGADAQYLALGAASGTLQFQSAPDYETPLDANQDNVYELNISVSDGEYHSSALLSVVVNDSNDESPQATSASSVALAIDSLVVGATIYTVTATDTDLGDQITYTLGGADQQHFTLGTSSGELAFSQLPASLDDPQDANGDNIYEVVITLADLGGNSSELALSVSVVAFLGSLPEFAAASASAAFDENAVGAVYTAQATDADEEVLSYSIAGDDAEHFTIDTTSGALEFTSPPDYEQPTDSDSDNIYELAISATDPVGNQAQQSLTVSINNLNDNAPQFASSSAEFSIAENNTSVTTITASDTDADTLTYAITTSADSELFTIDPASGDLAFISAPNYESLQDANADNVYELTITAADGVYSASQDLAITVTDVNEAPTFTEPSVALTTAENNSSFIYTVAAAIDPDQGQTLTYQLSGDDQSAFTLDPTTRALAFITTPNYENPTDQDTDNTYQIAITATDAEYSASQAIAIAVADLNDETPQFTSPSSQSVDYSTVAVGAIIYTAQASDADAGDQITYALGGADSGHFSFDPSSGELAFYQLPELADFPEDGSIAYALSITATDLAANSSSLDLAIVLLDDTGSAPTFAEASVSISVDENSADTVYSAQASDVDSGDILSYSISGSDADSFTINSSSGALAFQQAPDFENPADDNSDNTYELTITVTDSMAKQAQQSLTITVNNLNDNSPQFTLSSSAFSVPENSSGVATITASDADGDDLTFSLTNTSDAAAFTLDPSSGVLAFDPTPDYETPLDSDGDNVYQLTLSAFDGANTTTQAITVTVSNIDEAPTFAAANQDLPVNENASGSVYQAQATDPEQATLTYSASGADASLFTLDPTSGALAFNSPPNYEQPSDADTDNTYQLSITASDGANQATQAVAITVADVNEAPSFTAASVALATAENNTSFIYTVAAAIDPDQNQQLTYQLSGTDAAAFNFDAATRTLSFQQSPDFEAAKDQDADNVYQLSVVASDGEYQASQSITITVADLNDEAPRFTSLGSQVVDYTKVEVGDVIYTATATDADLGDQITYALSGADAITFTLDSASGALAFAQLPPLEQFPEDSGITYQLVIAAADLAANSSTLDLSVSLLDDTGSAPEFAEASASVAVDENIATTIYTAQATDVDPDDTLSYSLSGIDHQLFSIDAVSGALTFNSPPDHEQPLDDDGDNVYDLAIVVTDFPVGNQAQQSLTVSVTNLNDNPPQFALSSSTFSIPENSTAITTVAASDADGDDLTFSLTNSTDSSLFAIDPTSGVLVFVSAPDFENPADDNSDNTYELELSVDDGANTITQAITVAVTDIDEAPSFASVSESLSISENSSGAVYQAQASDPEQATLAYSISGVDASRFNLDASSGDLTFKTSPNFESPLDQDANNVYELSIAATDGANSASQAITISVSNVNEAPAFASASVALDTAENNLSFVHIVDAAVDPDSGEQLTYQLSGADQSAFDFDPDTRILGFKTTPNYELPADQDSNNVYQINIVASDSEYDAAQAITIVVADLNDEAPQFTSASTQSVDYSTAQVGAVVYSVQATDADAGDQITYALGGADAANFDFNSSSGELSFNQLPGLEDFPAEGSIDYALSITATDLGANSSALALSISLLDDTGSAPTFAQASASINVDENTASAVYTAQATDVDVGDTLSYSISGTDSSLFTIDPSSGALTFNTAPDFETPADSGGDNIYNLSITATDSVGKQASQSLTISVNNLNDNAPQLVLSSSTFSILENSTAITIVAATDADGDDLTLSLTNSTDANYFTLDPASGVLVFAAAPDFENPADNNADNTYQLELSVFDGANTSTESITIAVVDLNDEAPQFTSATSLALDYTSVAVGATVYTAQATDADANDQVSYTLGGADASAFSLDNSSGELAFAQAPSLDSPKDDNGDNIYQLTISATDLNANSTDLALSVNVVDDTGSAPTFDQASVSIDVDENTISTIYTAQATDVDAGDILTYSISGTDSSLFTIGSSNGELTFNTVPDFEAPEDDGQDNTYDLSIAATDSIGKQAQQSLTISVANLNDNTPTFNLSSNSFDVPENSTAVATIAAADADGDDLTFSLTNTTDSSHFTIDPTSGVLVFAAAPDFENPADNNADNTYQLELSVFDGSHTSTQSISVTVTNVDEAPSFAAATVDLPINENTSGAVYQAQASDPEGATLAYSASGADAALFTLDSTSGELSFNQSPNYEQALDSDANNVYELSIAATDGANSASQAITISVSNVNEAPAFASASVALDTAENNLSFVHIVDAAVDPDSGEQLTYQLGGDDQSAFDFDVATRALAFKSTPDYESPQDQGADNVYQINIVASDSEYSTSQAISIAVAGLNDEAPQFTSASTQSVDYSTAQVGAIVYTAQATDADAGDQITYALGGADAANFDFDSSSGELSFNQLPELEEFPADGSIDYALSITATDLGANSSDLALTISLLDDTGSAPTFASASASINVDENTASTVYTAQATDVDAGDILTYSIAGSDHQLFTIDSSNGDLSFNTAPDYENPNDSNGDNTYDLAIAATDSFGKQASQSLAISVNNLNDNSPQFVLSSTAFDVPENSTAITTITVSDADGDDLTLALVSTSDSNHFNLDPSSGALSFNQTPDFESPQDANADNTYELELSVSDGTHTTTQAITISVANIDEAPSFAAATQDLPVNENSSGSIYTAQATDPEGAALTYSASGADASLFTLDDSSGDLTFKTEPNFEQPLDQGADNTYNLTITASDGTNQASQAVTVTVADVNEPPTFASASVNLDIDENDVSFAHTVDAATDPDQGETLTYQLGGDDAAAFDFDAATRALSFKQSPNYEQPTDQNTDNVYQITITASDSQYSTSQAITVAVADLNDEAPQFTSATSLALDYTDVVVGAIVYSAQATDADLGDQITYALSGADQQHFTLDSSSGALAFSELPSLENPKDANKDNVYQLSITATDLGANSTDLTLSVNVVDDTGSAPTFAQASVSIDVDENSPGTIYTAQATDVDPGDILTYSISGTDSSHFTIDPSSGELSFNQAPDFENPTDNGKDNTYDLSITATDAIGKQASQSLAIAINNLNDNPPQFALASSTFSTPENSTAITTITATDADGDDLTFSLTTTTDANLFTIDPASGTLSFNQAPDFETPQDSNADNTYELELSVDDGSHTITQQITITVTNVDEAPSFASATVDLPINENSSGSIYTAQATDPEGAALTYSASGADASLFTLDDSSGDLTFKTEPNFEQPTDQGADNVYQLDITAADAANQTSQSLAITVADVNEAPTFASASVNLDVDENDASFTHIVDAADDPDQGETLTYQLGGDDAADFNFDASTRSLSFVNTPDYEQPTDQNTDNVYQITITASDADYSTSQAIAIAVADLNDEVPQFTSATSLALDYTDVVVGAIVYSAQATDADLGDQITYALSGADQQHFTLDSSSGALAFSELPSLENPKDANKDNVYQLSITATDSAGNSTDLALSINVVDDTGSAPTFDQANVSINVDENSASVIYTAQASDVDPGDILTYSISGTDHQLFTIGSSSGELSFNTAPDYENPSDSGTDNIYNLAITATDTIGKQASQSLTISVNNLNDNQPQFNLNSSAFSTPENSTAVTTIAATDADGDDLSFSLISTTDSSHFTLDPASGALSFNQAPDFESPQDSDADNTYELELSVDDGANTSSQAITVTVTDVDEAPSFAAASASVSVNENASGAVYQAQASDPEQATLTYSASGTDTELFTINSSSGELSFKNPPDYETPGDSGGDNTYYLTITVSDGANSASQAVTVTVTNVNEAPVFASASVNIDTDENAAGFVHTVDAATDPDQGETLTYQLGGDDAADFDFDPATRALSFKQSPNYEQPTDQNTDNVYQITITASDGDLQATQAITIAVANVEEIPYFHSTTDHVEITEDPATEGLTSPVLVLTIQAADDEDDAAVKILYFTISGGVDSDKFILNAVDRNSANLSFAISPDFDNPHDSNLDNNYSLTIQVEDSDGDTAQHDLIVAVQAVNDEAPQLTSASSADVNENDTAVFYVATAEDADRSDWSDPDSSKHYQPNLDTITFSLDSANYLDSSFFAIDASSGELQAASGLDYENPQSSAQSNNYTVGIKVADQAGNSSTSAITITVIDDPDESDPVASSGPQIPWFYSDVAVGESIDIPWVIYSGEGAIAWTLYVNGNPVCSESASISDPATSGVCSVSSSNLTSGSILNNTAVSVTYSDNSSELSDEVSFAYAASSAISFPSPSSSQDATACYGVDTGDPVNANENSACYDYLLGDDDFGGPHDQVPSYLDPANGRSFDVIAYYADWSIYRGFQPADIPVNLLSTVLYSFIMLEGDIPPVQAANADEEECEDCSFSGAVDFGDYWAAINIRYPTDTWCQDELDDWTTDSKCKAHGIIKQLWLLKQKFPHLKTCVSVGGWSYSRPFPLIASDSTKLATFVESITDMAVKYHFDCIDIDWEFPGKAGGNYVNSNSYYVYDVDGDGKTPFTVNPSTQDAVYFADVIAELRAELDSRSDASHIEINSAVYTSSDGIAMMDYNAFADNIDGIHMMAYDYYGAWDPYTGLQAALYANSDPVSNDVATTYGDPYNPEHNIASAMTRAANNAIDNGFESNIGIRRKLVPGIAFYGRNYAGVNVDTPVPGKYMVRATGTTGFSDGTTEQLSWEAGSLNYIQIEGYYEDGETMYGNSAYDAGGYSTAGRSWTYRWDSESMAPFLHDAGTGSFITYTDPLATFYQACHAARENSKGVMFWEISQDSSDFQLVQAIHTALRGDTMTQYADQPHCDDIIDRDTTSNNDDDGDTGGGDDDDDGGGGDTGSGDTGSETSGLQELEDLGYFTETVFNSLFYNTTLNQGSSTDGACTGYSFFNNWLDLKEAATYYPDFAAEGSMEDRLRELAAFLANTSHETTGAWQTYALDPALGARYHYGYCFKEEVGCENQTSCTQYCDSANTEYGYACSLGTTYHGRGPIQFTWNYNYGAMSEVLYGNNNYTLLENPSILVTDAVISYRSALWFWMTVQAPKPSAHDVMIGNYSAEASKNRYPGFGMTINIINGGLECGTDDFAEAKNKNRLGFYLAYLKVLGDAYDSEISPWVTESSTSITYGSTPATYSAFDLNEADLISRYPDVETYLSCKNMEHY